MAQTASKEKAEFFKRLTLKTQMVTPVRFGQVLNMSHRENPIRVTFELPKREQPGVITWRFKK
jgi:hypothetical protein